MELEMIIRVLLSLVCAALLIFSLVMVVEYLSGRQQRRAVRRMQNYFTQKMYPRAELAEHLRELTPPDGPLGRKRRADVPCPADWVAREERERNSVYFLRTGQQVSVLATMGQEENWYGLENWIRDLAAPRGDLFALVDTGKARRLKQSESDASEGDG